jgi:hypothetical protein
MIEIFSDFHKGCLDIERIKFGMIALLSKLKDASKIQQYRPICLLNYLYKWFTKVLTLRLEG